MQKLLSILTIALLLITNFSFVAPSMLKAFAQAATVTSTFQVSNSVDDVNQVNNEFSNDSSSIWLGTGGSATESYTGLRFRSVQIPQNVTITEAHFEVNAAQTNWLSLGYDIFADAVGNSLAFSASSRPSDRSVTTAVVSHTSNTQWLANTWYQSENMSPVIQEIINRPDWQEGNSVSLILKGTVGTWGRKFVKSYEAGVVTAPKLVVTFEDEGGTLPKPLISNVQSSNISNSQATISWDTDLPADSQVEYGLTEAYGSQTTIDPTLVTTHSRVLTGLQANTTHHFRVKSRAQNGELTTSNDFTFQTLNDTSADTVGQWSPVINWPLVAVHASLLPSGNIVMWDAWEPGQTPSARVWNPTTNTFSSVPNTTSALFCAAQAQLPDGRQLVIGGHDGSDIGITHANIFNGTTNSWSRATDMAYRRWYPTALSLSDGRVLAVGGTITAGNNASTPEVYDPTNNTWTQLTTLTQNLGEYPALHLMPDGKVFSVSGPNEQSQIIDVDAQTLTPSGQRVTGGTSVQYLPGKIMISGGGGEVDRKTAVIDVNQPSPAWRETASMAYPRYLHNHTVLPDGKVFTVGGSSIYSLTSTVGVLESEMWDPTSETWTGMAPMQNLRMYHSLALLLPDARVLVAGGGRLSPAVDYLTAEIYSPPYLFKGDRPSITDAPTGAAYNTSIDVTTPDAVNIGSVSLVRTSSITHAQNPDQRFIPLNFSANAGSLTVQTPSNAGIAPPGYYMLFILNNDGVPSTAKMILIDGEGQAEPTPTPTPQGPTNTPTPTVTPTPTSVPTATPTPTNTPTPTPTTVPGSTVTITKQITASTDDANQVNTQMYLTDTTAWLGTGGSSTSSYAGFRFTNVNIPQGAQITSAKLEVYSVQSQWISVGWLYAADDIGDSQTFSSASTNRISARPLTTNQANHSSNTQWNANTWYTLDEIAPVIQEVVNRSDWQTGNSLSVILKGTVGTWGRKFIRSFNGNASQAPRLVVTYQ